MATLRLFARARELAGRSVDTVTLDDLTPDHLTPGGQIGNESGSRTSAEENVTPRPLTVDDVIDIAVARYGPDFAALLTTCRIWVNGETVPGSTPVGDADEVAVLPPVSGG